MELPDAATEVLEEWFADRRGRFVDVILAGRIFGGRHGESPQQPSAYSWDSPVLRVRFGTTEQLSVESPTDIQRGESGQLLIPRAKRAVFGWHYYGRDPTPANWCEERYEFDQGFIRLVRTGPLLPGEERFEYSGDRFVELC